MTFVNDEGEVLDFDGFFAITKRAVSFFKSSIQGDFSVNFSVANNSVNRKVLRYDGPMMLSQVAFTRQPFTLIRNGNPFARGFIVIQQDLGKTLSCFFLSGNANWINLLTGLITELDFSGVTNAVNYELQLTASNVNTRMHTTEGIIFPMVDWCYDLNKGGNEWFVANLLDIRQDPYQSYFEWYPCFYLHTLVTEIMKQKGLKIAGNILDDKLYQSLVLTPFNGEMKRDNVNITTAYGTAQVATGGADQTYVNLTEASDPDNTFSGGIYTSVRSSKIIVTLTIVAVTVSGGVGVAHVGLDKNGVSYAQYSVQTNVGLGTYVVETDGVAGDVFRVYFSDGPLSTSLTLTANVKYDIPTPITVNDYFTPNQFLPALSCVEVIKFVINYFGCASYYNEYSKTITVNIVEKLNIEDAHDWSQYFQGRRVDYAAASAANNYLRLAKSEDTEIKAYNKAHLVKYGEGNITTDNTLKESNDAVKIPFAPSEFGIGKNGDWLTNIPLVQLVDSGEPFNYTAISNEPTRAVYEYAGDVALVAGQAIRIVDDIAGDIGIYIVENSSTAGGTVFVRFYNIQFAQTGTGKLYPQERIFNTIAPRLLIVKPESLFTSISSIDSTYNLYDSAFSGSSKSAMGLGYFCKSKTGLAVDTMRANAAFDNPDIETFTDPGVKELNFRKITSMLRNPIIPVTMTLPEAVYQSFKFDHFIYLKTVDLTGYFWVDSISNYQDSTTPVTVNLLMI